MSPLFVRIFRWSTAMMLALGIFACSEDETGVLTPSDSGISALDASTTPQGIAAVEFDPSAIDFGDVAFNSRKQLTLTIRATGTAPYRAASVTVTGATRAFAVDANAQLATSGILPNSEAPVAITFTPCPNAWQGETLRPGFDLSTCPRGPIDAELVFEDTTGQPPKIVQMFGLAGTPPQASLHCANRPDACGETPAVMAPCTNLQFGLLNGADDPPCDLLVEVRNTRASADTAGELVIDDLEILVRNSGDAQAPVRRGREVGFALLDNDRRPLTVTSAAPLIIPLAPNGVQASVRFWVRFSGSSLGAWAGSARNMSGLRVTTNDPDRPLLVASVLAEAAAPDIDVFPDFLAFVMATPEQPESATLSVRNDGTAPLVIRGIRSVRASDAITWAFDPPETFPVELAPFTRARRLTVTYAPTDADGDYAAFEIESNDVDEPTKRIEVRGGPLPLLTVRPASRAEFPFPPPADPQAKVELCNIGTGPLLIEQLDIDYSSSASQDEFSVISPQCASLPCVVNQTLCVSPEDCRCTTVTLRHSNVDGSQQDTAELVIRNSDPARPDYRVTLVARSR